MFKKSQSFLDEIVLIKKQDLAAKIEITQKDRVSELKIIRNSYNVKFKKLFEKREERVKLIAEIKFASPTNPQLGTPVALLERAKAYEQSGADAISIITENHFFKGDISFVTQVAKSVSLPILQKDFVIDPQQIYEAKEIRSDALLLIARLVDKKTLQLFVSLCFQFGIEPVVEINSEEDLQKAIGTKTKIIAVNARDLETFEISVRKACLLMKKIPDHFIKLGFSGINSTKEVLLYKESGVSGVLVGTSLMESKDIKGFIKSLQV